MKQKPEISFLAFCLTMKEELKMLLILSSKFFYIPFFKEKIRDEKKFNSVDELISAIEKDIAFAAHI